MVSPTVPVWITRFRRTAGMFIATFNQLSGLIGEARATGMLTIDQGTGQVTTTLTQEALPAGILLEDLVAAYGVLAGVTAGIPDADSAHVYSIMDPTINA